MYEAFYGLSERPFDITPNPKYLFLTPAHREALSNLEYGIAARSGVTVLIGEVGTGKTTLIRATLASPGARNTYPVYLNNPLLTRSEFLEFLAGEFRLGAGAAGSKTRLLRELEPKLLEHLNRGIAPALIIDEAQSLPDDLLEEVRLLANLETETEKLISIVLVGQPELAVRLNLPAVRQLKQRVALRCELRPLTLNETAAYIAARVRVASGDPAKLFTREAVMLIHERSDGIPRTIGVLCHNALINGFALGKSPVGADIVREVCRDLKIDQAVLFPLTNPSPLRAIAEGEDRRGVKARADGDDFVTSAGALFTNVAKPQRRAFLFSRLSGRRSESATSAPRGTQTRNPDWNS